MSNREKDDDYRKIIVQFGPKDRLIECADAIQWIFQTKKGQEWKSYKFCTSREGVLRWAGTYGFPIGDAVKTLPDRFRPVAEWSQAAK